ncbi:hypothetical protein DF268_02325 [Streptomyces sp. V2]|nr:hypothetical protein DF268_02325 [Streptomyces sp. V2]
MLARAGQAVVDVHYRVPLGAGRLVQGVRLGLPCMKPLAWTWTIRGAEAAEALSGRYRSAFVFSPSSAA